MIHTVKGLNIVNKAEEGLFLELPSFSMIQRMLKFGSPGSSAFSKSSLYIWKFLVHILLKPSWKDFEHNLTSV